MSTVPIPVNNAIDVFHLADPAISHFMLEHVPSQANVVADTLSRAAYPLVTETPEERAPIQKPTPLEVLRD